MLKGDFEDVGLVLGPEADGNANEAWPCGGDIAVWRDTGRDAPGGDTIPAGAPDW